MITGILFATASAVGALAFADAPVGTDFTAQCAAQLKSEGPPRALMADSVCTCLAEKTADAPALRAEFLEIIKLPQAEREKKMSTELRAVRKACVPFAPA